MATKYTRPFTPRWRWLIAGASVSAFLGSWAIVAHTPNPYENSASAAPQVTPALEQAAPLPGTNNLPFQNLQPTRRQRRFQQLPLQNPDSAPQVQPDTQTQLPTTRGTNQGRMRSGGS